MQLAISLLEALNKIVYLPLTTVLLLTSTLTYGINLRRKSMDELPVLLFQVVSLYLYGMIFKEQIVNVNDKCNI